MVVVPCLAAIFGQSLMSGPCWLYQSGELGTAREGKGASKSTTHCVGIPLWETYILFDMMDCV